MSDNQTNNERTHSIARNQKRQTFTVRMPADVYFHDWTHAHQLVQQHTQSQRPVSNSVMVRLGVWALHQLRAVARQQGEQAEAELGEALAQQVHKVSGRKRGPDQGPRNHNRQATNG